MYAAYRVRMAIGWSIVAVLIAATVWLLIDQNRDRAQVQREREAAAAAHERSLSPPAAAPSPSPSPTPVAVPTPDMTGRDFDRIARQMIAFRDWMAAHPADALAADAPSLIYRRTCECYEIILRNLQALESDGARFDDDGYRVLNVEVFEDFGPVVSLRVTVERTPQRVVDEQEQTIETGPGVPPHVLDIVLEERTGRWVVLSMTNLGGDR